MIGGRVTYHDEGAIARIRLDDGETNAFDVDLVDQLDEAFDRADAAGSRAIVLEGREGVFSSGVDYRRLVETAGRERRRFATSYRRLLLRAFRCPRPLVAAVTGHAIGGGALLMMACDVRWGVRGRFQFGVREVAIGLPVPAFAIEIARLRIAAPAQTRCLVFGELLPPLEARRAGLLQRLLAPGELRLAVVAEANRLAALPAAAFAATKAALHAPAVAAAALREDDDLTALSGDLPASLASVSPLPTLERRERARLDAAPPPAP